MKKSYILAVCAALASTVLAGCGPADENTDVLKPDLTEAVTEAETTEETAAETTAAETSEAVSETTTAETTAVSETTTAEETTAAEETKAAETEKQEEKAPENNGGSENQSGDNKPSDNETQSGSFGDDDLTFTFGGSSVTVGKDLSAFKAAVAPSSEDTAPSCLGNGEDSICTFDHFTINGYTENGQCIATAIDLTDSEVSTSKGIKLGSSKDDVIKAYGTGYTERGSEIVYVSGKSELAFRISGDEVKGISYNFSIL